MTNKGLRSHVPVTYRICAQGYLDQSWSDRLSGMTITASSQENEAPVTTLSGR